MRNSTFVGIIEAGPFGAVAINHGVSWEGWKVVDAAAKAGYTDVHKTELISLTEFEKLMGKKKFAQILGEYVVKPPGKLSMVPESDPRPAVDMDTVEDEFEVLD